MIRIVAAMGCVFLAGLFGGCSTYYGQAIRGQWQMMKAPRPIGNLLKQANLSPDLKNRLELVLRIREFAEAELHLKVNGHYAKYADLGRPFVVWNVYAAPEFSLEDKTWWFPIVGSVSYRGYFRESLARHYGERLERNGWDVFVGGVEAYSTLGWFRDPVLNTFIGRDGPGLAELLFHELAHQRLFIAGDTEFNEAFATAVAGAGVRRWLRAQGNEDALASYEVRQRREQKFVALLQQTRSELEALYAQTNSLPVTALREQKAAAFSRLQARYLETKQAWNGYAGYDGWFVRPLNNALLNTVESYHHLVPGFAALLTRNAGDFETFYREARQLGRLNLEERHRRLKALADSSSSIW